MSRQMTGRYGVAMVAWIKSGDRGRLSVRGGSAMALRTGLGETMDLLFEVRKRAREVVWPALAICALAYVAYHIINGDRGLVAWRAVRDAVAEAKREAAEAQAERVVLAHRVKLLHPDSIDPDMLEEWARRQLNYGRPDDIVILTGGDVRSGQRGSSGVAAASAAR